jgi:hypothetical protein
MVGRYLKSQLFVLLCGGLVGPIFLIVYFAFAPLERQLIQWMFFVGLLITVADVLIALALANYGAKSAAKTAVLEQNGVLALAQITGMSETGTRINDEPLIKLALHIAGPGFAFDTQKRVVASVTRMGNFSGRKLVVLVDPATQDYQIDWERSALVNGLVPAQFTLAEDNETYDLSGQAGPLMEILQILKANNIPLSGMLDVRSNPALRQQLQAVVRRAAASQPAPASVAQPGAVSASPVFTPPKPLAAQRLQELETLRVMEAITEDEYTAKRQQIISDI